MARNVTFTKDHKINDYASFKKGVTVEVSDKIYKTLVEKKVIELPKEKKAKAE